MSAVRSAVPTAAAREVLAPATPSEWRAWLAEHAGTASECWLRIPHRRSGVAGPTYDEAVRQALCFGWIDSHHRRLDEHSSRLRFSPRRARSTWSELNRRRAAELVADGQMTDRGLAVLR